MWILCNQYFLQFGVPLIATMLTVFVKYVTRKDGPGSFQREDLAVGFDLSISALMIFIAGQANIAKQLVSKPQEQILLEKAANAPWILLAFFVGIWGLSTLVRKVGWNDKNRLSGFVGIFLPDTLGIVLLAAAVNWAV